MKKILLFFIVVFGFILSVQAQKTTRLSYFSSIPIAYKNCGAQYTYDSVSLGKKKFFFVADFQDRALIMLNGKKVALTLKETNTVGEFNHLSYKGGGYTVKLVSKTDSQGKTRDLESGTLEIIGANAHVLVKIHGQSACDPAKQEPGGN